MSRFLIAVLASFLLAQSARAGADIDGDGVSDELDVCCDTAPGVPVDESGRPVADLDADCDVDLDDFAIFELSFFGPSECTSEVCDLVDNDCNCLIDDLDPITCGVGQCRREVQACINGVPNNCVPGQPATETCADGLDTDCDGLTDCADFQTCPLYTPCAMGFSCDPNHQCACQNGFLDCDAVAGNGCERSVRTLTDCGGCSTPCNLANAFESCSTGTCLISSCNTGFCNIDSSHSNGCEVNLDNNPVCPGPSAGSVSGDTDADVIVRTGVGEAWYHVRVTEGDTPVPTYLSATVRLEMPAGMDYDLYVYCHNCGGAGYSSTNAAGQAELLNMRRDDVPGPDDSFTIIINVRWFSGNSGGCDYTLTVNGNTTVANATCN